ncbi:YgiQ family radical SAM protein [Candidatus Venteria ishoeyi]|uniref:YgiQ family radical SAM protein n=1 Tax=Candidatus Venteria ishoeyi TaxID=1899563 RepID=UPI0025A6144C|nr:YgiQ family radical SAM protein [Candidatus Venteria ishoeyi]MDM8548191.1 YgiQ family radical SAM protein [Candidatus Venteria ishoeyi]
MEQAPSIFSYRPYWAQRFGTAPILPTSREEMENLGWDSCDIIIVTGDAYVDLPSFGMALIGRLLEAQGFRVGIITQPDWRNTEDFMKLGPPNLFFGVTAGNMDSMVNRYTAERRRRSDDAYTPNAEGGKRPDRSVVVYSQRCREAYHNIPLVIGGIEASLRRIAHYDYWSDKVRRSILIDSKADLLFYGNAERAIVEFAHRLARKEQLRDIRDIRGTAFVCKKIPPQWQIIDSTAVDKPGKVTAHPNPYANQQQHNQTAQAPSVAESVVHFVSRQEALEKRSHSAVRLPAYEQVKNDPVLYAHTSRLLHLESNPGNARPLIQAHGDRELWLNPPPIPLSSEDLDRIYELPYTRCPHPSYQQANIPAYEMIRFSINIMRGCFGGCSFCSITEHEGRIIQNRSEDSIIREIETIRDTVPGFTGVISDLGGPTANMYHLHCKDPEIESACRRLSCVYPGICKNMKTNHYPLIRLYRRARQLPGIKRILIASGLRYDLAVESPEYVKELVSHHVGGYLKIAPEHTEDGPLSKMMKPGIATFDRFKIMFDKYSKQAGKEQYLIPYFIAAHPGTTDKDMMHLALWLKRHGFRADQVQAFLPSPMSLASAMYHGGKNPLKRISRNSEPILSAKGARQRRLHKAFLRYHDSDNWPLLREALKSMGRADLIGNGKKHLVPSWQPKKEGTNSVRGTHHKTRRFKTQGKRI